LEKEDLALIKPVEIAVVGAGKLSWHLSQKLFAQGHTITQIFSRQFEKAEKLAKLVGASATNDLAKINTNTCWVLIAVADDAIEEVSEALNSREALFIHTSGSAPINLLNKHKRRGVFYPLQSFSLQSKPNWNNIPIFIDASKNEDIEVMTAIAQTISNSVVPANDKQREQLHLAAVFANNFSNHLFVLAQAILKKNNLPFSAILPLINETVNKLQFDEPKNLQTGPAIRNDVKTIEKHLEMLDDKPELYKTYQLLTQSIINQHN